MNTVDNILDNILGNCRGCKVEDSDIDLAVKPLRKISLHNYYYMCTHTIICAHIL